MTQDILVHTEAGVATITFNRVDKKNSITRDMYAAMADALEAAQADASVRVVVFQGDVAIFSAGNDIGDFLQQPPATQDSPVFRFLRGIATFPKPVIAAVCGPAVGIGTTMLFHCDLVYAGDNAAFSMPFVNLGLCPEAASSLLVPQMLGYHRAAEALLLGEPFMAEAALEVGLVNRVVPHTLLQQNIPDYLRHRIAMQDQHMGELHSAFGDQVLALVPEMERYVTGLPMIEKLAAIMFA